MTTEQALREAFSSIRARLMLDVIDSHTISLVIADCDQALALPTAAPDKDSLNKLVEIMRWVDAYAVDYATEGKLAKSRQDVEREIARNVAPRVTTEMFDQLKSNLELIKLSQKTLEDANALTAAPVGEREALLCDLRTWHAMLNQLDQNARATLTSETAAELLGRAIEALALPTQQYKVDAQRTPLTDEQIDNLIHTKHFDPKYKLHQSDKVCLKWYRLGLRDGERAHGISKDGGEVA